VLFSTDTGDAWLLDPADRLAARLARDGDPQDLYFKESDTRFAIGWKGNYRIDGDAFICTDRDTGRVLTILGYPTQRLAQLSSEVPNTFGWFLVRRGRRTQTWTSAPLYAVAMERRAFLQAAAVTGVAGGEKAGYLAVAEALKPVLTETRCTPVSLVQAVADSTWFLRWRMDAVAPAAALRERRLKRGDAFILDFGRHMAGYFTFSLVGEGDAVDSPVRLRIVFGEVPGDVAEPLDAGTLSRAWMPDEIVNVDFLPRKVRLGRRHAFRYVKVEVMDTSPNFAVRFDEVGAAAVTSAGAVPKPLPASVAELLRRIDQVSIATLRDCMQTVFEDGPRRDQRLWIGDLRLQALTNYATFRNFRLVKRCLYLFAGLPREDGLVAACVYDNPRPLCGRQYIMDYAVLYGATVRDYVAATGDTAAARALWPVVKRQMEIVGRFVGADGVFRDPGGWWIFIDWREELDKTAAMHAVLLFGLKQALEVARAAGKEHEAAEYATRIGQMREAARAAFYDAGRKVFVSGKDRQVSWASQAWMVHAGVAGKEEGAAALRAAMNDAGAVRPGTPYLYHYFVDAMLECGMKSEALDLARKYWGGMVEAGADTFWEIYDPSDALLSPYKSVSTNSYCHAWSCTPAYLLRARGLGGGE
jgi:alpha-L-rhamnosidase